MTVSQEIPRQFAKNAKILQIDVGCCGDQQKYQSGCKCDRRCERSASKRLLEEVPEKEHPEWIAHIQELKAKYPLNYDHTQLTGPYFRETL